MKRNISKTELTIGALLAILLIFVLPALNAAGVVSNFTLNLWGKYLCYGVLAISVDILWGYTGLLSLGQALFFSLGGYMLGMHLMLQIGKLGQWYLSGNNPNLLPDFMIMLGRHDEVPVFWKPFYSAAFAGLAVVAIPGLLALVFGFFAFRSRIKGVYFSILTQALTYGAYIYLLQNDVFMGGNNGFTDFKFLLGADLRSPGTQRMIYITTALLMVGVYIFCRWLTTTKFGLVQRAIRDSETRVLFSGYAAANYKLFVFVLAALIASTAGALYVPQVGIINPGEFSPGNSIEAVVWVAVGGRGTLVGAVLGAFTVNGLKTWLTSAAPDLWLFVLGGLFVLVTLLLPRGLIGLLRRAPK